MPLRDLKFSPGNVIAAHFGTYVNAATGRVNLIDHGIAEGLPVAAGLAVGLPQVRLDAALDAGLVTVSGLLSAFFFGAMLQVAQRAMDWSDTNPLPGPDTSEHATFLGELAANSGYASLVSIAAATVFVGASVGASLKAYWLWVVCSAVGAALAVHLVIVLFMVIKRTMAVTESRLNRARTGAGDPAIRLRR